MKIFHVYKTNSNKSSRIVSQTLVDGGTIIDNVSYFDTRIILFLLRQNNIKVVFHQHAMLLNTLVFYFVNKLVRLRAVVYFDCHDINEYHKDYSLLRKFAFVFFDLFERLTFKCNIQVMCPSRCFARMLYIKYGKCVHYIPNVPSDIDFNDVRCNKLLSSNVKHLVYFGHINESRLPINAIKLLSNDAVIDIYGKFAGCSEEYTVMIKKLQLENRVRYLGEYNPSEIISKLHGYDASLLVFESDKLNIKYCMPNKLYQSLASGVPCIISPNLREIKLAFRHSHALITIDEYLEHPSNLIFDQRAIDVCKNNHGKFIESYKKIIN